MEDDHQRDDPEQGGAGGRDTDQSSQEPEPPDTGKADEPQAVEDAGESSVAGDKDDEQPENGARKAAAWGRPFARIDKAWTRLEAHLCAVVLLLEVLSLSLWVGLKGMSSPPNSGSEAGIVFRGLAGALVLGLIGFLALKKRGLLAQRIAASTGVVAGIVLAKAWTHTGVEYSSNLLNWYQQASSLTLLGGLRGVGTRLTLMLALLGGSLATAAGKHITIDLITRFLKPRARLPVVVVGWLGSSLICFSAAWGFFDYIAIDNFGARANVTASQKFVKVGEGLDEDWFILRKQVDLDFKALPHVLKGQSYSNWLTGKEWNAWLDDHGFVERYGKNAVEALRLPDDAKRSPIVVVPEKGEPRGELINAANLVFPFGLFVIAMRFILLSLLAISGHMTIDPEAGMEGTDIRRDAPDDETAGEEAS